MLPKLETYGQNQYMSKNYGIHCLRMTFENLSLWYSYETIVAFWTAMHFFVPVRALIDPLLYNGFSIASGYGSYLPTE